MITCTSQSLETLDNGKAFAAHGSVGDTFFSAMVFKYYAGWADKIHGKTIPISKSLIKENFSSRKQITQHEGNNARWFDVFWFGLLCKQEEINVSVLFNVELQIITQ